MSTQCRVRNSRAVYPSLHAQPAPRPSKANWILLFAYLAFAGMFPAVAVLAHFLGGA